MAAALTGPAGAIVMELFATACVLSRQDSNLQQKDQTKDAVARLFIADSLQHAETCLRAMRNNDDLLCRAVQRVADLEKFDL